uniref:Uncharacterized protein n=1 Tax=viral metagenome TaxID=1070528 RepID=A0A6M3LJ60_9ZZZZ
MKKSYIEFLLIGLIIVILTLIFFVSAYYEAKTYSRLTGKQVSWFDAVWVDFRIQEQIE